MMNGNRASTPTSNSINSNNNNNNTTIKRPLPSPSSVSTLSSSPKPTTPPPPIPSLSPINSSTTLSSNYQMNNNNIGNSSTVGRTSASSVAKQLRKMSTNSPSPSPIISSSNVNSAPTPTPSPLTINNHLDTSTNDSKSGTSAPSPRPFPPSPSYKKMGNGGGSSPNLLSNSGGSIPTPSPPPTQPSSPSSKRSGYTSSPSPIQPLSSSGGGGGFKRPLPSPSTMSSSPSPFNSNNLMSQSPRTFTNTPPSSTSTTTTTTTKSPTINSTPINTTNGFVQPSPINISKPTPKRPALPPRNELQASSGTMMIPKLRPVAPLPKPTNANSTINAKRFLKQVIQDKPLDADNSSDEDDDSSLNMSGGRSTPTSTSSSSSSSSASSPSIKGANNIKSSNGGSGGGSSSSGGTSPSMSLTKEQQKMVQRNYLAQEILTTEKKYINNLNRIMTIFVLPLRDKSNYKDKILSTDEINAIFMNIDTIFGIHKTFLSDFESRIEKWSDTQKIGDVFLKMAPYLRSYTVYSNSYNSSILLLSSLAKSNPTFQSFLAKCLLKPASKGLNLSAYLIMPIQRIPRYKLLLENMLSNSPEGHVDFKDLKEAIGVISAVASELDERLLQFQIKHKVLDIQNQLAGCTEDLVKPTRVFLKEGDLKKISDRVVNTRHFFLFNDLLIYAQKEKKNLYRFKHSFSLETCWVKDIPDTNRFTNLFQIISSNKTYFLCAPTVEDKMAWMKLLNEVINKLVENNPEATVSRSSIYEKRGSMSPQEILKALDPYQVLPGEENESELRKKPLWLKDQMTKACMHCNSSFTMTRRRHHCRKCFKIFCNDCCPVTDLSQYMPGKKARICKTCYEEISVQLSEMMSNIGEDTQPNPSSTSVTPSSLNSSFNSQTSFGDDDQDI